MKFFTVFLSMLTVLTALPTPGADQTGSAPAGTAEKSAAAFNESILASVNGEGITLADVLRETAPEEQTAMQLYSQNKLPAQLEQLRRQAVDRIIDRKLLVQEFQRLKLELPSQYVENLLDDLAVNFGCKTRSELARKAREAGTSLAELRTKASQRIMADMVIGRELYGAAAPTPREMYEYFQEHEQDFSKPEEINLALLLLAPDANDDTVRKLSENLHASPDGFAEAVKAFSVGPNREQGGTVGFLDRTRLREEFLNAVNAAGELNPGMVLGPVATEEGRYFLKIVAVTPGVKADFAKIQPEIEKRMDQENRSKAVDALRQRLREKAVIRYHFGPEAGREPVLKAPAPVIAPVPEKAEEAPVRTEETAETAAAPQSSTNTPEAAAPPAKMEKKTMVTLKTNYGDIKLELFPEAAPETVKNFLEYVKSGFYNGTLFHRVIDNFMIQGGGFDTKFRQKPTNAPIRNEADNRLSNATGTIAMARTSDPHSATAQFFINVADNDFLDFRSPSPQFYGYCVFGKVVEGMDVVNKIKTVATGGRGGHQDVPKEDVVILEATAEE